MRFSRDWIYILGLNGRRTFIGTIYMIGAMVDIFEDLNIDFRGYLIVVIF